MDGRGNDVKMERAKHVRYDISTTYLHICLLLDLLDLSFEQMVEIGLFNFQPFKPLVLCMAIHSSALFFLIFFSDLFRSDDVIGRYTRSGCYQPFELRLRIKCRPTR